MRSRLGREPFSDEADRDIEGSVTREGPLWRAHLSVIGPNGGVLGSRDLQSSEPDCATLADAVTLAVVLVIDPRAALAEPRAEPTPPTAPEPAHALAPAEQSPVAAATPAATAAPPAGAPPSPAALANPPLAASLRGVLALGLLPRAAFGVESAAEVGLATRFGLTLGVSYFPEVRTSDKGFAFGLSAASLGLCIGAPESRSARLAICGEGQVGAMHAVVYVVQPLPPGDHVWAGARVGPRLLFKLGSALWLEGGSQLLVPLLRHEFVVKNQQRPVFQSSPMTFAATLGLSASIR